ncbi:hypothetical protein [Hymenobacter sp. UYP22]|uniref:hypothetical protein n=1 Tax=Hymenobacter sp. UYP22 TaxID=3156348 RepID=UPI003396EC5C
MRKHSGMRPQDVVVLLKILTLNSASWQGKDLATALFISPAEISDALRRCQYARLLLADGRTVQRQAFLRFLRHGLPYVFPAHPGGPAQGIVTAWSAWPGLEPAPARGELGHVWADPAGSAWGLAVPPLYTTLPSSAHNSTAWHQLLALLDVLRLDAAPQRNDAYELLCQLLPQTL